ncbi:omptin family outer membrane protease [Salmonella enterica subsp. enterica serovar Eastbourne]|nr:omptin family outer membrane protease [Salmonella enterica subsp. enterica serovar Eastbourne]
MQIKSLIFLFLTPVAFNSLASEDAKLFTSESFSTEISLGTLTGKTKERVYAPVEGGRKISQLDWKYNNAVFIKGSASMDLKSRISVSASGWITLDSQKGNMVDTDWLDVRNPGRWTEESRHPDTHLNYANEFDLNVKGWILNEADYRLGVMAGYQESRYSFNAKGGSYIYSSDAENNIYDRGDIGTFSADKKLIGYKQIFRIPYIGLTSLYRYKSFELGTVLKYSAWVQGKDNDEHYSRNITFRDKVSDQYYYSVALKAGYFITPDAKVFVEGAWNRITNNKGDTVTYDRSDNTHFYSKNTAAIEGYNIMALAGFMYRF